MGRKRLSESYKLYLKKARKDGIVPLSENNFLEAKETLGTISNVINKQSMNNNRISDYYLYQIEFEKIRKKGYAQTSILMEKTFQQYKQDYPDLTIKQIAEDSIIESRKRAYKIVRMLKKKQRESQEFKEEMERLGLDKLTQKDFMKQSSLIDDFWDYIKTFDNGFAEVFYE